MQATAKTYFRYKAFGSGIWSVIEMPMTPSHSAPADMVFDYGPVPMHLEGAKVHGAMFESVGTRALIAVPGVARYLIEDGRHVTIDPADTATNADLAAFLSGMVCGILMHQRHYLPVHGTSLVWEDNCLVFSGLSGAGKSTLSAWFVRDGAALLADDVSAIQLRGRQALLFPGLPVMRLWEDSLAALHIPPDNLKPVRPELRKYYWPAPRLCEVPQEVHSIFVLGNHNLPDTQIQALKGMEKFRVLKNNVLRSQFVQASDFQKSQFGVLHHLAANARVYRVRHPRKLSDIDTLGRLIINTIREQP